MKLWRHADDEEDEHRAAYHVPPTTFGSLVAVLAQGHH